MKDAVLGLETGLNVAVRDHVLGIKSVVLEKIAVEITLNGIVVIRTEMIEMIVKRIAMIKIVREGGLDLRIVVRKRGIVRIKTEKREERIVGIKRGNQKWKSKLKRSLLMVSSL